MPSESSCWFDVPLIFADALIVAEEEEPILDDRAAGGNAEILVAEERQRNDRAPA